MYSSYNDYKKARDLSWEILIRYNISSLPVDILNICHKLGIRVYTYHEGEKLINKLKLTNYANRNDGFATIIHNHYVIFYNDTIIPAGRVKFTLAHELGHILLNHIKTNAIVTRWNQGEETPSDKNEVAANQFAARLLAPAFILRELNIKTAEDLSRITGLSHTAAEYRLNRLNELIKRNKFYLSPLERQVRNQFDSFIKKQATE